MKKKNLFYFSAFFLIFFQFIDQENFPDYLSYQRIFNSFGLDFESDWEPFFVFINFAFNKLGFSYDTYRFSLLFFCILCVYFSLANLRLVDSEFRSNITLIYRLIIYLIFSIIYFEFFIIRIRSGLCLSLFILAYSFLFSKKKTGFILSIIFFILSSQTHLSTFYVLTFLLLIPYFANKVLSNYFNLLIYFVFSIIISFLILIQLNVSVEDRGAHMYSELNYTRFFLISVIPIFIYFSSKIIKFVNQSFVLKKNSNKIPSSFLMINYITLSIALFFLYPTGVIDYSGEAIVRIFTLSSIVFLVISNHNKISNWYLLLYLGFINSLFFINTVFI
jgi:hypothetical protein